MLTLNKQYYLFAICILYFVNVSAQNLVPNPSFEESVNFDTSKYSGWHKAQKTDTPDYFNLSYDKPCNNIFDKFIGGVKPHTGNGFAGIFCYRVYPNNGTRNIREFIETPLISKLEKDSLYKIQISLSLDEESNVAIKNFGIFFSSSLLQFNKDFKLFAYKPQVEFNSTFLDSTKSWITLYTLYKAQGFENYIIIGNFKPDRETISKKIIAFKEKKKKKKWDLASNELASYYYVDDVIVEKNPIPKILAKIDPAIKVEIKDTFNINEIKLDTAIILKGIVFDFDKADLLPLSFIEINKLYYLMVSHPTIRIKLEGHTDNIGSYDYNLQLSQRRVEAVVDYLIEKGITPDRIEFAGYSYSLPIATNDTEEGRQINRRVVFRIIEK
jgi:Outer membrane protein and related peptidoglycan-associated (lipo)proteins